MHALLARTTTQAQPAPARVLDAPQVHQESVLLPLAPHAATVLMRILAMIPLAKPVPLVLSHSPALSRAILAHLEPTLVLPGSLLAHHALLAHMPQQE